MNNIPQLDFNILSCFDIRPTKIGETGPNCGVKQDLYEAGNDDVAELVVSLVADPLVSEAYELAALLLEEICRSAFSRTACRYVAIGTI